METQKLNWGHFDQGSAAVMHYPTHYDDELWWWVSGQKALGQYAPGHYPPGQKPS